MTDYDALYARVLNMYNLNDTPKSQQLFYLAWEYGQSNESSVLEYADDLVDLLLMDDYEIIV